MLTLFPDMFPGPLGTSLAGQALDAGIWSLDTLQIRDFGIGKHRQGVFRPRRTRPGRRRPDGRFAGTVYAARTLNPDAPLVYMTPRGQRLSQQMAHEFAAGPGVTILAGRFEGIDERVIEDYGLREISIGDYVLSGGELAGLVLLDAVVRLLPGVIGSAESLAHESFEAGLLEYPHYTKPREWRGRPTPEVLLSGDHKKIAQWRQAQSEAITAARRPDLLPPKPSKKS